jgi:hypothetical protein
MRSIGVLIACAGVFLNLTAAYGLPKRIIILRHAEKSDDKSVASGGLCGPGPQRAEALIQYLGSTRERNSLFQNGEKPAAFYANTDHAAETIAPAYATWPDKEVELCTCQKQCKHLDVNNCNNLQEWSKSAAQTVLTNKDYKGEIVVMAWEHSLIGNVSKYNEADIGNPTLSWQLGLSNFKQSSPSFDFRNWCGSNYDFFWIVDYDPNVDYDPSKPNFKNGPTPINIEVKMQELQGLPQNTWGCPEPDKVFAKIKDGGDGCTATQNPACPRPQTCPSNP